MIVRIHNDAISINITEENVKVFDQMHGMTIDTTDVEIYLIAFYQKPLEEFVENYNENELSSLVNQSIIQEARDIYGEKNYFEMRRKAQEEIAAEKE